MKIEKGEELLRDLDTICAKYDVKKSTISSFIEQLSEDEYMEKMEIEIEKNKQYVGKTYRIKTKPINPMFPNMYRYVKVVSERGSWSGCVSCLVFDEKPYYWFEYQAHKLHQSGDYYLGNYEFESFYVEEIRPTDLKKYEEIDNATYKQAMLSFVENLNDLEWTADHYRAGGVMPDDPKWKEEKKRRSIWDLFER